MSTSNESPPPVEQPLGAYPPVGYRPAVASVPTEIDPNNPPWGVVAGILTFVGSIVLLILMGLLFVIPAIPNNIKGDPAKITQFVSTDKTAILLQILSTIPAHLLTLGIIWAVVTRFGKRPFWKSLGWSWSKRVGFWKTAGLAVALFLVGLAIGKLVKGQPTDIDQMVDSSTASRYALAFIAGISAPFIEELVFRGVLYSALQKTLGIVWAVAAVSILFALVHVLEYRNNVGVILVISILSLSLTLLRAYSGRLLPCYIVHLIFNGITAIYIIVEPYLPHSAPDLEHKAPALIMLARSVRTLI
ncbi:MAG: protease family protein [Acidobacteriota bacterium]|nr:protease family protein [Acidobacteriota bacterium]